MFYCVFLLLYGQSWWFSKVSEKSRNPRWPLYPIMTSSLLFFFLINIDSKNIHIISIKHIKLANMYMQVLPQSFVGIALCAKGGILPPPTPFPEKKEDP